MPPNHTLLSSTLPPHLVSLHHFSQDAGQMLMRMGAFPLLLSELNQHGLSRPEDLSLLLHHFLQLPLAEVRLSRLPDDPEAHEFEIWQFDELEGLITQTKTFERLIFDECCARPLRLSDFSDPSTMHIQTIAEQVFGHPCSTYINVPLLTQGQWLGVLHCARSEATPYNETDYFVAQMLGQSMALVMACERLKVGQTDPKAESAAAEGEKRSTSLALAELEKTQQQLASLRESYEKNLQQLEDALVKEREAKETLQQQLQALQKTLAETPKGSTSSSYVAAPPPKESLSKPAPAAGLKLPPIDALRNAFRPRTQVDDDGVMLLEEVDAVPDRPIAHGPAAQISFDDMEIETDIADAKATVPGLLCLTTPPSDSLRSFARIIQAFDFRLLASPTIPELLSEHKLIPPMSIGLTTTQLKQNIGIFDTLYRYPAEEQIPLFEANEDGSAELAIRLHWNRSATGFIKDTFWHRWLQKTRNAPETETTILAIGSSKGAVPLPIIEFFCGQGMDIKFFDNPVDGIQMIYQAPPRLFVLELQEEQSHWVSLFTELGRSARTLEMPILLISKAAPQPELWDVIQPFTFLLLSPSEM